MKTLSEKTQTLAREIAKRGQITEREKQLIQNRLNRYQSEVNHTDYEIMFANGEISVTDEQARKGFLWLWNQHKTPMGKERKNNPFGYREIDVLNEARENGATFTFDGFYDAGRVYRHCLPLYSLYNEKGSFQYYVCGGEINIVG